jgi:16S rRNA G966 N2-methylase RsmD
MPSGIRPTQDKVRKALFDILGDIEGFSFLELFAGSGAVGFEAISRGAKEAVVVEQDSASLKVIKGNLSSLGCANCTILALDALKAIEQFCRQQKEFDLIFLDPPYYKALATPRHKGLATHLALSDGKCATFCGGTPPSAAKKTLQTLGAYDILAPNGFVVAEHFKRDELPEEAGNLKLIKESSYGDTLLSFYSKRCAK